jgi:DNA-binding transcriptional LysR family regulator
MARIIPDRAAEFTALVTAVERGGFSAAARQLGVTPSAMSKTITRLENRLGVRLLNRTTRRLALTPEGEAFFARGQRILAEMNDAEQEVTRFRRTPSGLLRMHSLVAFGLHQLPPVLPEFLQRYPDIQVELTMHDRLVDLIGEGGDLAVRTGLLPDSTLVARRICDTERTICAAPAYLRRRGTPKTPDDLLRHDCLCVTSQPSLRQWPFKDPRRRDGVRTIEVNGRFAADNAESVLQQALQGVGIVRLGELVVAEHLRAGRLVPLLVDMHHVEPVPLWAVYPQARLRSPKVAAMVEFLIEKFADAPWRRPAAARPRRRAAGGGKKP